MKLYLKAIVPALYFVLFPIFSEWNERGGDPQSSLDAALSTFLKSGKEFSILSLNDQGGTATGTISFFDAGAAFTLSYDTPEKLRQLHVVFNTAVEFKNRDIKKLIGNTVGDLVPRSAGEPPVSEMTIEFEGSTTPRSLSVLVKARDWKPVDKSPLSITGPEFTITALNPTDRRPSVSAVMKGSVQVASVRTDLTGQGSSSKAWMLSGTMTGLNLENLMSGFVGGNMGGLQVPAGLDRVGIQTLNFQLDPVENTMRAEGESTLGDFGMKYYSDRGNAGFLLGFTPPAGFRYANLDPSLDLLDKLGVQNSVMALSSGEQNADLAVFSRLGAGRMVTRGLNLITSYDLTNLSPQLTQLIGKTQVDLMAVISNRPADMVLSGGINTNIRLDQNGNVTFRDVTFYLKPSDTSVSMSGSVDVRSGGDILNFKATMGVDIKALAFEVSGQMNGTWSNPFGISGGVHLRDLGLLVGASFATTPIPLPALAMKGTLIAGDVNRPVFTGDVTVGIFPYDPMNTMIDAGFSSLSLGQVVSAFAGAGSVPSELQSVFNSSTVNNARITIVPNPAGVTLFDKTYDPGFLISGNAQISEFSANLLVRISQGTLEAKASISPIDLSPVFSLKGVSEPNPYLYVHVQPGIDTRLSISGTATLLGISATTDMHIRQGGYDLYMSGKIFNAFQADLVVNANSATNAGSYYVKATLQNDLYQYLTEQASMEIDKATKDTQSDITRAQQDIAREQAKLQSLNRDIESARNTVRAERERDCNSLRNAEADVESKRMEVQRIQSDIDNRHGQIAAINKRINDKEAWVNATSDLFEKAARGTEFVAFAAVENAKKTPLMTEIAAFETAKATANLALIAAREILKGMGNLCDATPIDLDPRVAGLITARETANASMEAAKAVLEGAKIVGVGTLQASKWIVQNGNPMGVVNVTYAYFEGGLSGANGGGVKLRIKGTFADQPLDTSFDFNFNDPMKGAQDLAAMLLK